MLHPKIFCYLRLPNSGVFLALSPAASLVAISLWLLLVPFSLGNTWGKWPSFLGCAINTLHTASTSSVHISNGVASSLRNWKMLPYLAETKYLGGWVFYYLFQWPNWKSGKSEVEFLGVTPVPVLVACVWMCVFVGNRIAFWKIILRLTWKISAFNF